MSASQFEPGKTTTPTRTRHPPVPLRAAEMRAERLDRVLLDHRVAEELAGKLVDERPGRRGVGRVDRELHATTDPHLPDPGEPEMREALLDGPALRVEDPVLGEDVDRETEPAGDDLGAHRAMTSSWR